MPTRALPSPTRTLAATITSITTFFTTTTSQVASLPKSRRDEDETFAKPPNEIAQQRGRLAGHHAPESRPAGPVCCNSGFGAPCTSSGPAGACHCKRTRPIPVGPPPTTQHEVCWTPTTSSVGSGFATTAAWCAIDSPNATERVRSAAGPAEETLNSETPSCRPGGWRDGFGV